MIRKDFKKELIDTLTTLILEKFPTAEIKNANLSDIELDAMLDYALKNKKQPHEIANDVFNAINKGLL
jgi:arginyl-tRNA synthetase